MKTFRRVGSSPGAGSPIPLFYLSHSFSLIIVHVLVALQTHISRVAKCLELSINSLVFQKSQLDDFPESGGNKQEIRIPPTRISRKLVNFLKVPNNILQPYT